MPVEFDLDDDVRRLMAQHHRATQAFIQGLACKALGYWAGSKLGIDDPMGGVRVGRCRIAIARNRVFDIVKREGDGTPEERSVVEAVRELAERVSERGEASFADGGPSYHWYDMAPPLRAMLDLPEKRSEGRPKVIFLDIDGVLLRPADWMHPCNAEARLLMESKAPGSRKAALDLVRFDPGAVELVNRLARQAAARIVVSSFWRITVGEAEAVRKILAQGIEADLLHEHAYCPPVRNRKVKEADIEAWLSLNRTARYPHSPRRKAA